MGEEEAVLRERNFVEDNAGARNRAGKHAYVKSSSIEQESPNRTQANKREATTPLSSISKKFSANRHKTGTNADRIEYIEFAQQGQREIFDLHWKNWLLQQALEKKEQLLAFLEMERKVQLEELQGAESQQEACIGH